MVFLLNWEKGWGFKYPEERRFRIFEIIWVISEFGLQIALGLLGR